MKNGSVEGGLTPVLVPGGAVLCDRDGKIAMGLSERAFDGLGSDAPGFLRLAAAHLAAAHAAAAGRPGKREQCVTTGRDPVGGVTVTTDPTELLALAANSFLSDGLRRRALELRRAGSDVVPVIGRGATTYVGPLLRADAAPCIACVQRAVAPNRPAERMLDPADPSREVTVHLQSIGRAWLRRAADLVGCIVEVDGKGTAVARHLVRRFPDCIVCGSSQADPNAIAPRLRSRATREAEGVRWPAKETEAYNRLRHLVDPLTGAVRHVSSIRTGAPGLIHAWTAGHAMHLDPTTLQQLMKEGSDTSGGKGWGPAEARLGALCEGLERLSAVFRGDEVDAVGSLRELPGAIHPAKILRFSEGQYRHRGAWNRKTESPFQRVPEPFDERSDLPWTRVWSLITGREALIPTAMMYFGVGVSYGSGCSTDSNGLAAGPTFEDAVLRAFHELIERDAVAIWWYNRTTMPEVRIDDLDDGRVKRAFERYAALGRRAWVLDLTSDLGIPVFAAVSAREGAGRPEIVFGFGADLDPARALRRGVLEMNQMLATAILPPEERAERLDGRFRDALAWWDDATLENQPYLAPSVPSREPAWRGGSGSQGDPRDDVQRCLDAAHAHGLDVYVRDMTRPDIGVPVVRVVVPGLRHFWRRLAPGRLYDVPVSLGRMDTPLTESLLNPVSLFV